MKREIRIGVSLRDVARYCESCCDNATVVEHVRDDELFHWLQFREHGLCVSGQCRVEHKTKTEALTTPLQRISRMFMASSTLREYQCLVAQ